MSNPTTHSLAVAWRYAADSSLGVLFGFNALFLTVVARIQFTYEVASSDTSASSGGLEEGFAAS